MLRKIIIRSLLAGRRRLALAAIAVLMAAAMVAALSPLSFEMRSKAGKELASYGANLVLVPRTVLPAAGPGILFGDAAGQDSIAAAGLDILRVREDIDAYVPYLYALGLARDQNVVIAGAPLDQLRLLAPYWQIQGQWAPGPSAGIVGKNVAARLSLQAGDEFELKINRQRATFMVAGVASIGGSEDNQVFIDLAAAQRLSGREGQADLVQIRAGSDGRRLTELAAELENQIPGVEARVIRQIADAEARIVSRIELLMALLTVAVVLASALAVFSAISAGVLERTGEIGLIKVMGARSRWIMLLFLSEAWTVALAAGVIGTGLGFGLARAIGASVFSTSLSFRVEAIPLTFGTVVVVTTLASLWPVRSALGVEPVTALNGE